MNLPHSPLPTRLCLIRHGETAWNTERRIQGQLDIPLAPTGRAQARAVARRLANTPFAAIYASDLARALSTAQAVAERLKLPVETAAALRERHYGALQGSTYAEFEQRYPQDYARFLTREETFALPGGGESLRAFADRVNRGVDAIVAAHPGQTALLVTHGGVLDILRRRACNRPLNTPRDFEIPNAGINWLEVDRGAWTLLAWAERGHLDRALDELPG